MPKMVEGVALQQQVPQKVEDKPGQNDQDGETQACPQQTRHFVRKSWARVRTFGKAAAHAARDGVWSSRGWLGDMRAKAIREQRVWIVHPIHNTSTQKERQVRYLLLYCTLHADSRGHDCRS